MEKADLISSYVFEETSDFSLNFAILIKIRLDKVRSVHLSTSSLTRFLFQSYFLTLLPPLSRVVFQKA